VLHEKTGQLLDRVRRGERFIIVRDGVPDGYLVPASESVDPPWSEIMAEVWELQKKVKETRPNPVLAERKRRNRVLGLR
jgi:prevent-host-death family protein